MQNQDEEPSRPEFPIRRTWGIPLAVMGLALLVGRFLVLPLVLEPRWLSTVIAGLSSAAVVLGVMTLRRGRGAIDWGRAIPMAVLAGGALLAALWWLQPASLADTSLRPFSTAAFEVQLPDWGEPLVRDLGGQGQVDVKSGEVAPLLKLQWLFGEPAPLDEYAGTLEGVFSEFGRSEIQSLPPASGPAGPVPMMVVIDSESDRGAAVANVFCPSGLALTLAVMVQSDVEQAGVLLGRVVDTIRCRDSVVAPEILRASWKAPDGFEEDPEAGETRLFYREHPDGRWEGVGLPPVSPDLRIAEEIQRNPVIARAFVDATFPGARPTSAPPAAEVQGSTRTYLAYSIVDVESGETLQLLYAIWPCPDSEVAAVAMYMTGQGYELAGGVELLNRASCPGR